MHLEIISRKPKLDTKKMANLPTKPKLVFVHGICVGAWIWDETFLPYFAEHGYEVHALSLRGHGKSDGEEHLPLWTLANYADDLDQLVKSLEGPVIVIGHSLGGAVLQEWLRTGSTRKKAKAAALLASIPPWGLAYSAWHMMINHPLLFQEITRMSVMGTSLINEDILLEGLFSPDVPKAAFEKFLKKIGNESLIVSAEVQGLRPFAPLPWTDLPPIFVGGGLDDRFIPSSEVHRTAAYYGVDAVIIEELAHTIMIDTNWEKMASILLSWIEDL
ncbi:MAG: alpha/beta hydrolase [Alphaproteobacteria bacterium]|nr:alpha/beta hydrolase [Alphaproteobacteria bacterium]